MLKINASLRALGGCERPRSRSNGGGRAAVPAPTAAVPAAGHDAAASLRDDLGAEDARPEERRVAGGTGVSEKGEFETRQMAPLTVDMVC